MTRVNEWNESFQYWLAVSKTLDVGQQVHFECVPLLEGFATLQRQKGIIPITMKKLTELPRETGHRNPLLAITYCQTLCTVFKSMFSNLITHVWFLRAVGFHVLGQPLLHGVNSVTHRAGELWHLWSLRKSAQKPQGWLFKSQVNNSQPKQKQIALILLQN